MKTAYEISNLPAGQIEWRDDTGAKRWACFAETTDAWPLSHKLRYEIVFGREVRFASILKTVVYVAIDEDAEGKPVLQSWNVKTTYFPK